jgi:hypothetical protein
VLAGLELSSGELESRLELGDVVLVLLELPGLLSPEGLGLLQFTGE